MAHTPGPSATLAYTAAAAVVDRPLRAGLSLFTGEVRVWSRVVLEDLRARLEDADHPGVPFAQGWAAQLAGAPARTVQLAAELLYVHLLFATDLASTTKRRLVSSTLELMVTPARVPEQLDAALEGGIARTGIAFKARRRSQLKFLLAAAIALRSARPTVRAELLEDPWRCKAWLHGLPVDGAQSQRSALLHLLHPETFEPVVSERVKHRVVTAFAERIPEGVTDIDEALLWVREALEPQHGRGFRYTDPPLASQWR